MRPKLLTAAGLALPLLAVIVLLLAGRTSLAVSADEEAAGIPLAAVVVPLAVGLLLTRLVPWRLPALTVSARAPAVLVPLGPAGPAVAEPAEPTGVNLRRQAVGLVVIAVVFPLVSPVRSAPGGDLLYPALKLLLLLGGGWLVLRRWPAPSPARGHRALLPRRWYWLGPAPAVLAWAWLGHYSPLAGEPDLSGYATIDPVFLAGAAVFTFLTASVTEEIFYRVLLQTRLEALLGRWPAIAASALLFAALHVHRYGDGPAWEITAVILVSSGGLGLLTGYLWARYRNVWALIVLHGAANALGLLPLLFT
ncbi:CPBP family intramembrane metalloprotease [Actinoplanes sp. ATCC 53533]|uniref:CPBP family intramembrane glutamic endopeptidase n=1 Tax=Actinoplanes sp. ATCC 53533 TaxID=1288362 RepID=UPI000F79FDD2|nr:CPBP family intramembrane glutamic endopeptidase [Actinoplanes sp. ATCC 53533]RSM54639.1 CPBP family intramembrane metalloprotease [Actinoplanes sp. ATCC 53533]